MTDEISAALQDELSLKSGGRSQGDILEDFEDYPISDQAMRRSIAFGISIFVHPDKTTDEVYQQIYGK